MIVERGRFAFIPYVMAGDPDLETTALILAALRDAGVTAIELGVPYGDPLADGPTIAAAGSRALAGGTRLEDVFDLVRDAKAGGGPPTLLFTYYNPIYQYGIDRFADAAANAGAAGAIVPDVTLEESGALRAALASRSLLMPLLVAPSTPRERAARIAEASSGFVYVVSRLGVTGAGSAPDFEPLRVQIEMLRGVTDKPLAAGFGISTPDHVRAAASIADGAIVGSALIDAYAGTRGAAAASHVRKFCTSLRSAADDYC